MAAKHELESNLTGEPPVDYDRLIKLAEKNPSLVPIVALVNPVPLARNLDKFAKFYRLSGDYYYESVGEQDMKEFTRIIKPILSKMKASQEKIFTEVFDDPLLHEAEDLFNRASTLLSPKRKKRIVPPDPLMIAANAYADIEKRYGSQRIQRVSQGLVTDAFDRPQADKATEITRQTLKDTANDLRLRILRESIAHFMYSPFVPPLYYGKIDHENNYISDIMPYDEQSFTLLGFPDYGWPGDRINLIKNGIDLKLVEEVSPSSYKTIYNLRDIVNKLADPAQFQKETLLDYLLLSTRSCMLHYTKYLLYDSYDGKNYSGCCADSLQSMEAQMDTYGGFFTWFIAMKSNDWLAEREELAKKLGLPSIFDIVPGLDPAGSSKPSSDGANQIIRRGMSFHGQLDILHVRNNTIAEQEASRRKPVIAITGDEEAVQKIDTLYLPSADCIKELTPFHNDGVQEKEGNTKGKVSIRGLQPIEAGYYIYLPFHPDLQISSVQLSTIEGRIINRNTYAVEKNLEGIVRLSFPGFYREQVMFSFDALYSKEEKMLPEDLESLDKDKLAKANAALEDAGLTHLANAVNIAIGKKVSDGQKLSLSDLENVFLSESVYSYDPAFKLKAGREIFDDLYRLGGFLDPVSQKLHIQCDSAAAIYTKYLNIYFSGNAKYYAEPILCYYQPEQKDTERIITGNNKHARVAITNNYKIVTIRDTTPSGGLTKQLPLTLASESFVQNAKTKEELVRESLSALMQSWKDISANKNVQSQIAAWTNIDVTEPLVTTARVISLLADLSEKNNLGEVAHKAEQFSRSESFSLAELTKILTERVNATKKTLDFMLTSNRNTFYNTDLPGNIFLQLTALQSQIKDHLGLIAATNNY
ncbi:MAG: hypothetical protein HYT11_00775 [Candidatus Levybacteria bacterium]|nr:hypothetical protein [Candidatus Levybacteria bacterium]